MDSENEKRICQNCSGDFIIETDDFSFYKKVQVPAPTFCPDCRSQRRLVWRNNMSLYNRTCDLCMKPVVSTYAPDSKVVQYCNKCWWSDAWDPKKYAKEYDFSQPFFEQFRELIQVVPHMTTVNDDGTASLNCKYTYDWWFAKNCYMTFSGWKVENIMYSFYILAGKDMMDCVSITDTSDWLYECTNCDRSYQLKYSQFANACSDSQFLYDCKGCTSCFMCAGLRNKKYCFKNVEYSKEEYMKIVSDYKLDTFSGVERAQKEYDEFILSYPRKYANVLQSVKSSGDVLTNCKNAKYCFNLSDAENCKFYDFGNSPKDSYDISMTGEMSECYEGAIVDHSQLNRFGVFTVKSQDVTYTQHCHSSKHLFGCVGLRNGNYCILNKEYTKEEYEALVPKIIDHMNTMPYVDTRNKEYRFGEFYPIELSPYSYNETVANERFPLAKEESIAKGYGWQENLQRTTGKETMQPENIPESINTVNESILQEVLSCVTCKRNYKIVPDELRFYVKMKIPIPHRCFHCRHANRIKRRNPFKLCHRSCMCNIEEHGHTGLCSNEFETSYAPDRPEIIYCEQCYQKEVS